MAGTESALFDYDKDRDLDLFVPQQSIDIVEHNHTRRLVTDATGKGKDPPYRNVASTEIFHRTSVPGSRTITPKTTEAYAEIVFPDRTVQRRELYYGEGYLSHSSRRLQVPENASTVTLHNYDGTGRRVDLSTSME